MRLLVLFVALLFLISCKGCIAQESSKIDNHVSWENSISNPDNWDYVVETAFNNGEIPEVEVTQTQFNQRYHTVGSEDVYPLILKDSCLIDSKGYIVKHLNKSFSYQLSFKDIESLYCWLRDNHID